MEDWRLTHLRHKVMSGELKGPSLDEAVAFYVMGWTKAETGSALWETPSGSVVTFAPTVPGSADWLRVTRHLEGLGYLWSVEKPVQTSRPDPNPPYQASFFADGKRHYGRGQTPGEAVCRAAIEALRQPKP